MKIPQDLNPNVAPQTVSVYTRHGANCPKRGSTPDQRAAAKNEKRCKCPKWIYLFHDGTDHRFSASTRSWEKAEQKKQELERELDPERAELRRLKAEQEAHRIPVSEAVQTYLSDVKSRNLARSSYAKLHRLLNNQLLTWAGQNGIRYLDELTTARLTSWRNTWVLGPLTRKKTQGRVSSFLNFCIRQDWLKQNPVIRLTRITVQQTPTEYFTREEFDKLVTATHLFGHGSRNPKAPAYRVWLRALLLLMRWSGLRIGDAVTLERSRLVGNHILLYQAKTGTPVFVPLPAQVAELLRKLPEGAKLNSNYFFWSGAGDRLSVAGRWRYSFTRLFEIAHIRKPDGTPKHCHPHMLRHTFAIEMLLSGVPLDQVSKLLGHSSTKITEEHYAQWVRARQEQLEKSVALAHAIPGISKAALGGTTSRD